MTDDVFVRVAERSQVGEARRTVSRLAEELGFDDVAVGRVAIAVTELASNLVEHAEDGGVLFAREERVDGAPAVEVLSVDGGPGIPDVGRALRDGYSTGATAGTGLGAVERMSDAFQLHSAPGTGTVCLVRINERPDGAEERLRPLRDLGAVRRPDPTERRSGDSWAVRDLDDGLAILVVDGLGHGPGATEASAAAVEAFQGGPWRGAADSVERMHGATRGTRGAAAMVVERRGSGTLRWAGVGNVAAALVRAGGTRREALIAQNGILGRQVRRPREEEAAVGPSDLLVVHTDGIRNRWKAEELRRVLDRPAPLVAGLLYLLHYRGRDDATAVVHRGGAP